jgi:fido (protein-threonine AMPylation protein)
VFHSIKLEGSNLTKGETDQVLEGRKVPSNPELIAPGNVRDAYRFALPNAKTYKESPELFIREIHKIVLRDIDSAAGSFRNGPVKLSQVAYEPPQAVDVAPFMQTFASELKAGPQGKSIVHFAAEAHSKLVAIHPFFDGNGRTARLLMDAILVDAELPPAIIYFQDKERYLECLKVGNGGDLSPFSILLAETVDAAIDEMLPRPQEQAEGATQEEKRRVASKLLSQTLADIVRKKTATLPLDREARYKAWQAGFESFRREFHSVCAAFNDEFSSETLFQVRFRVFDTLAFEKYETLLRGLPTPRTWFFGIEVSSERHSEQFVFSFRAISELLRKTGKKTKLPKELPPRDVTLVISRWSDGTYHRLENQPIRLREVYYSDGQFLFLKNTGPGVYEAVSKASSEVVNNFLADVLQTYF